MRDAGSAIERTEKVRFNLPTVEESIEALKALNITGRTRAKQENPSAQPNTEHLLTEQDIPWLRQQWYEEFKDILQGTPEELPLLRKVNHEINLIDPDKKYFHRLPSCPVPLRPQFYEKLNRYVNRGWWKEHPVVQAALLMCISKKDGRL